MHRLRSAAHGHRPTAGVHPLQRGLLSAARRGSKAVPNCLGCEERRRTLEQRGVSDADEARIVSLLSRDFENTVGPGHEQIVEEAAARIRLFSDDLANFEQTVVDEVQRELHDSLVDTSWPRCPAHFASPAVVRRALVGLRQNPERLRPTRNAVVWSAQTRRLTLRCTRRPLKQSRGGTGERSSAGLRP